MTKLIAVLVAAAGLTVATPRDVSAAGCTEDYMGCVSDAGLLPEPYRSMKDLECGAAYTGCVVKLLKFW